MAPVAARLVEPDAEAGAASSVDAPLRTVLATAADELRDAATSAAALQVALGPLLRRGGEGLDAFQALDALTQELEGLRGFLETLAAACPAAWRVDVEAAADGLRLHAQKLRLTGAAPAAGPGASADHAGELELW